MKNEESRKHIGKIGLLLLCLAFVLSACAGGAGSSQETGESASGSEEGSGSAWEQMEEAVSLAEETDWKKTLDSGISAFLDPDYEPGAEKKETTTALRSSISFPSDLNFLSGYDTEILSWGPGSNVDEENRPTGATYYQSLYGKYDADFIRESTSTIYLTIDEGYENGYTSVMLDVLKEKGVSAVFFVTMDYVVSEPELVQRMIDEGHVVGGHSVTHPSAGIPSLTVEEQLYELQELHEYVEEHFGYTMYLFRFPAGIFSEQSIALVQACGYRSVFWSFAYRDWVTDDQMAEEEAMEKVVAKLHPGAIYLLHAVSSTNAAILGDFIDEARALGYSFGVYEAT